MAQQRMRTHTEYDYEHLLELKQVLSRALTRRRVTRQRVANLALGLFALIVTGLLILNEKHWVFVVVLAGIAAYFILWGAFYHQFAALATLRALDASKSGFDYILEKNYLLATNVRDGAQYRYDTCLRLLETERNFLFIMQDGQGVMLDKANVKGGTVDQLRTWLEEKSGKQAEWMGKGSAPYETK